MNKQAVEASWFCFVTSLSLKEKICEQVSGSHALHNLELYISSERYDNTVLLALYVCTFAHRLSNIEATFGAIILHEEFSHPYVYRGIFAGVDNMHATGQRVWNTGSVVSL